MKLCVVDFGSERCPRRLVSTLGPFTQAGEAGLLKRTIASNATYSVPGNASEGVRSAGPERRTHSSTVGDTSPRDAFPALSSWFAEVTPPRRAVGTRTMR
jgi:hypothetical protein